MGRKEGGLLCPFCKGELGPRLTQSGLGWAQLPYQVGSSSIQPFGHNRHGPETGAAHLWGELDPHLTQPLGPRPTSLPCAILNHQPFGRSRYVLKIGGSAPFGGGGAGSPTPHLTQCGHGPRPTCTPSFMLTHPTVWQQYINITDRTDRQPSDSIGRTVSQTVTQNLLSAQKLTMMHHKHSLPRITF